MFDKFLWFTPLLVLGACSHPNSVANVSNSRAPLKSVGEPEIRVSIPVTTIKPEGVGVQPIGSMGGIPIYLDSNPVTTAAPPNTGVGGPLIEYPKLKKQINKPKSVPKPVAKPKAATDTNVPVILSPRSAPKKATTVDTGVQDALRQGYFPFVTEY